MSRERQHHAYIGMGSNIEPARYLKAALSELARLGKIAVVSSVYESPAVGDEDQPNFLNAAVLLLTTVPAKKLCPALREIEATLGRVRDPQNKNASRTIDLDLVLYDKMVQRIGHRRIPDPDILKRSFLAVPLAEISPDVVHPTTGVSLGRIAESVCMKGPELTPRPEIDLVPLRNRKRS